MLDLEAPGSLKLLSETIHKDINSWCVYEYDDGHRSHLGASLIGHSCSRYLWYLFRWVFHYQFSGRMYRLFQRGHREEDVINQYLTGMGCEVQLFDKVLLYHPESECYFYDNPDNCSDPLVEIVEGLQTHEEVAKKLGVFMDKGKRQIRISACQGHFGGSIDGKVKMPKRYGIQQDVIFLSEDKTQGTQKFAKLQTKGVQIEKYQHFCQQSIYGFKLGLEYALYISANKNNDDLHVEVIKLDHFLGQELENKAEKIIFSQTPPNKVSASANFFECNWCDYKDICWNGKPAEKNCRSCHFCKPVDNAQWECHKFGIVPKEHLIKGCEKWVSLI